MKPTRQDVIDDLQNRIWKNRITYLEGLRNAIEASPYKDIEPYEEVLSPMGYNTCDRCGSIQASDFGLFWLDGFDWEDGNPTDQAILKALAEEKQDYCAICYDCLNELKMKGRK